MATEATGTHKDPVTGEMISKTLVDLPFFSLVILIYDRELKRREKQRAKEASKAAKPPPPAAKAKVESKPSDDDLNPNVSAHAAQFSCRC